MSPACHVYCAEQTKGKQAWVILPVVQGNIVLFNRQTKMVYLHLLIKMTTSSYRKKDSLLLMYLCCAHGDYK